LAAVRGDPGRADGGRVCRQSLPLRALAIARWAGVAYLVYLAVGALRSAPDPSGARAPLAVVLEGVLPT
jgi:arginine exporter protein ArgO